MAKEAYVIGCMHLGNLCSGNVILFTANKFRKLGGKGSLTEKIYISCNYETTNNNFLASNNWPHNKSIPFNCIHQKTMAKKLHCPLFVQNAPNMCCSRLSMISDSIIIRNGIHHSFTYHFLCKDHCLLFLRSCCNKT